MTTVYADWISDWTPPDVYRPQEDSRLLIDVMIGSRLPVGRRVADLCTGSGVVGIAAAAAGATQVVAVDLCPRAVRCARANASAAGVRLDVHLGSWARAREFAPFDLVLCNPPYVPHDRDELRVSVPSAEGPALSYDGGPSGRLVLDPLCTGASELLDTDGTLLIVQSEFADVDRSLDLLRRSRLRASIAARTSIPFGPVLSARASWLERSGRLQSGVRFETLVVIRADMP